MTKHNVLYVGLNPCHYIAKGQLTHLPLIEIVPRPDPEVIGALANFSQYTHVIITSKSTVQILKDTVSWVEWKKKTTIAVGQITAKYLAECGIHAPVIAHDETAEGLVEVLKNMDLSRAFVFWPHAALARPLIANYLYENLTPYAECSLYDTKLLQPAHLPDLEQFDEIVFTSPSTVDAFLKAYGAIPSNKKLTTIGPITQKHLQSLHCR